ncbi:MAG TPA: YihY/virulence factor BrkB family protein [Ilumatobacteraceae bacterium]|nr:YihY/virulence factor BrkB family protein [Ilumatobacteraceae bacterium]
MPWSTRPQVMAIRRRSRIVDVAIETLDCFRRHQTGRNAAVLAYWGFLSVFPLLLAATTILGFVLEGDEQLRTDIVDSALNQIPVVGSTIKENAGDLEGNTWALVIGLATALWASMKAFIGVQAAFDDVWEVDIDERANIAVKRLRALLGLVAIGLAQVGTVVLAGIAGASELAAISKVLIVVGALVVNIAVVATMFRFLTAAPVTWTMVWPGAVFSGVLFTVLQLVGTVVVSRMIADAGEIYGTFASMLALMSWFSLHALISLYGAELNAALERRREQRRNLTGWLAADLDRPDLAH